LKIGAAQLDRPGSPTQRCFCSSNAMPCGRGGGGGRAGQPAVADHQLRPRIFVHYLYEIGGFIKKKIIVEERT
jgi:hypothetical protein